MNNRPQSIDEWSVYIQGLSSQDLFSQAVAANTQAFARSLLSEGAMQMDDVERMMLLFVRQLRATGTKVPDGGAFDLMTMAMVDPIARKGPTMSEGRAGKKTSPPSPPDDLDDFLLEAAFVD